MDFFGSLLSTGLTTYLSERRSDQERKDANDAAEREFALAQSGQANTSKIISAVVAIAVIGGGFLAVKKLRAA